METMVLDYENVKSELKSLERRFKNGVINRSQYGGDFYWNNTHLFDSVPGMPYHTTSNSMSYDPHWDMRAYFKGGQLLDGTAVEGIVPQTIAACDPLKQLGKEKAKRILSEANVAGVFHTSSIVLWSVELVLEGLFKMELSQDEVKEWAVTFVDMFSSQAKPKEQTDELESWMLCKKKIAYAKRMAKGCLLYTSPSPRDS